MTRKVLPYLLASVLLFLTAACTPTAHRDLTTHSDLVVCDHLETTPKNIQKATDPDLVARLNKLSAALEEKRKELHIPGMALAVVKDDAVIFTQGYGVADVVKQTPVTPETMFAVASTSKAFTTALIGMMVEEGKMDWDDPITKYIPEMQLAIEGGNEGDVVTIRDMLSHQTGFARMSLLWVNGKTPRREMLADSSKAEPYTSFRKKFYYNNVMYLGAGEASAVAAGTDWDQLLSERILSPLGMVCTTPSYEGIQNHRDLSLGYMWDEVKSEYKPLPMRNMDMVAPAGGIHSNVLDMSQWVRFNLNKGQLWDKRLIAEEHLTETWKPQIKMGEGFDYGMGWMLQEWEGQKVVQHGGNIDGYGAMVALLPESNLGFVLLINVTASPIQQASINMVWDHLLGKTEEAGVTVESDTKDFSPYLGEYIANFGNFKDATFAVKETNGKLGVDVPGQTLYELKSPDADGVWFFALTNTISVSFEAREDSRYNVLRMHQGGFSFEIPRKGFTPPPEIDESELRKYLGTFHSEKMGTDVTTVIQSNRLAVDIPKQMTFELTLPDEKGHRHFRIRDELSVTFQRDFDGRVVSMTSYKNGELKDVMPRVETKENKVPTLAEIHALRHTEAQKAALNKWGAFRMTGTINFPQAGVTGALTTSSKGSGFFRQDMDMGKYGSGSIVVTPDSGSATTTFNPLEEFVGKYLEQARQSNPAMIFGDWADYFETIEVVGNDVYKDKKVHLVQLKNPDAPATTLYIDAETGDVLKQKTMLMVQSLNMTLPVTNTFSDFREQDGLRMPFRTNSANEQTGNTVLQYERVETGVTLPPSHFKVNKAKEE